MVALLNSEQDRGGFACRCEVADSMASLSHHGSEATHKDAEGGGVGLYQVSRSSIGYILIHFALRHCYTTRCLNIYSQKRSHVE